MPYVAMDHTINFAIDAAIKASHIQQIDQNIDYLKALMAIATGHTHDQGGTDQGGPVVPANGTVTPDKLVSPSPGDYIIQRNPDERSTTSGAYVKLKEDKIGPAGTYRIKFSLHGDGTYGGVGQIWKNGVAFGIERNNGSALYTEYSEDLTFAAGDLVQVYCKVYPGGTSTYTKELKICVATPLIAGALNGY